MNPVPVEHHFFKFIGTVVGGIVAYFMTSNLPGLSSAFVCAVAIALSSFTSNQLSHPIFWWGHLGAIAGGVLGTASILTKTVAQVDLPHQTKVRYTIIGLEALGGLIAGIFLGRRDSGKPHAPTLKKFLGQASTLTAGAFATIVTIEFILAGLGPARVLSSRLSTATTIVVTSIAVPGLMGYLLGSFQFVKKGQPPP